MGKEILTFDENKIEKKKKKKKTTAAKVIFFLTNVDIEKVRRFLTRFLLVKKYKYFIGYFLILLS